MTGAVVSKSPAWGKERECSWACSLNPSSPTLHCPAAGEGSGGEFLPGHLVQLLQLFAIPIVWTLKVSPLGGFLYETKCFVGVGASHESRLLKCHMKPLLQTKPGTFVDEFVCSHSR